MHVTMYLCAPAIILVTEPLPGVLGFTPQNKLQPYLFRIQDENVQHKLCLKLKDQSATFDQDSSKTCNFQWVIFEERYLGGYDCDHLFVTI